MTTMMHVPKLILMCSDQWWNFCRETDFVWYIKLGILLFITRQDPAFSESTLWPCDAIWSTLVNIGQAMTLRLISAKTLPEPMLTYGQLDLWNKFSEMKTLNINYGQRTGNHFVEGFSFLLVPLIMPFPMWECEIRASLSQSKHQGWMHMIYIKSHKIGPRICLLTVKSLIQDAP